MKIVQQSDVLLFKCGKNLWHTRSYEVSYKVVLGTPQKVIG